MRVANTPESSPRSLTVSVVVYHPDQAQLSRTLADLATAFAALAQAQPGWTLAVELIDNGGLPATYEPPVQPCRIVRGRGNVGYGRGHNLALGSSSGYHLILNPDIDIEPDALVHAFAFLEAHPEAGLLTPRIDDEHGALQYLCRRYPAVLDLFVRGFLPARLRAYFRARLDRYEMRDVINDRDVVWNPPIVSGCFMLFRNDVLGRLGGFDPRYFLYFEDYDLSLRAREVTQLAYVPSVRVRHYGGGAGRKGWRHIRMFCASAFKFFSRFGWKWL